MTERLFRQPDQAFAYGDIPETIEEVLAAARRVHPDHGLFVTFAPMADGPTWEFHPFKRWLVLRTEDRSRVMEAVTCTLLARTAWLGKGAVTSVPQHLLVRYRQALDALEGGLGFRLVQEDLHPPSI